MTLNNKKRLAGGLNGWRFQRVGGVLQPVIERGADIARLESLDQKYWMALSMPVAGVEYDARTAEFIDTDHDGHIRPPEILAAVRWLCDSLNDPELLVTAGEDVPLAAIRDSALQSSARQILKSLGKESADHISLSDVADRRRVLNAARYNGDGVLPPESAGDDELRRAILEIMDVLGSVEDRGGKPGINREKIERFFREAEALIAWADRSTADARIAPLGPERTAAAAAAVCRLREKVEDYFARCRLIAFDPAAVTAVHRSESDYRAVATEMIGAASETIAAFPMAIAAAARPLPLTETSVNPAWAAAIHDLRTAAVEPLLGGERMELSEADWRTLLDRLSAWEKWTAEKPLTAVESLGLVRLKEMSAGHLQARLIEEIERDLKPASEFERLSDVEKLVRFRRHLFTLLCNSVNFRAFYRRETEVLFQAGTLYLDGRACRLCIEVTDPAKHAALATFSGAFLVYCDLTRAGSTKKSIVAVITDGDADNILAGRNGVFYDRRGLDWDATVTKVVSNPISIREAFWSPYKKLVRMIEEQFARRAQAADTTVTARLGDTATQVVSTVPAKTSLPSRPEKIDLGTIALIGTAIGGISALIGGLLQALFGLGWWLPVGLAGILLLISGPSMFLAALKLRRRNLGPILDANGWAINTQARLNIRMGTALTELAVPPLNAIVPVKDPFADKKRTRMFFWVALLAAFVFLLLYRSGRLGGWLPFFVRS